MRIVVTDAGVAEAAGRLAGVLVEEDPVARVVASSGDQLA
jgi:hypothetical protein